MESVPACGACAEEVEAGRAPSARKVLVDGRRQSYWHSPAHVGYLGHYGSTVADLVSLDPGLPLGTAGLGLFDWLDDWFDPGQG